MEDKANLVASIKVRFLLLYFVFFGGSLFYFGWVLVGYVVGFGFFLDEPTLISCCACLEHAGRIGVAAYGRAGEPRAQGQEARREA